MVMRIHSSYFTFDLPLDEYEVTNLREGLLVLQKLNCDTGDWLGQILMKLPETTARPNIVAQDQIDQRVKPSLIPQQTL